MLEILGWNASRGAVVQSGTQWLLFLPLSCPQNCGHFGALNKVEVISKNRIIGWTLIIVKF